ncbi:hypothetical protein [Tengunoibacter tsumagoiensis]|uniref:Uncharacterized protein n=1 Tax=Tengunoibacter tsumagoiensis TaxID=2014871 RepID=A0A402A2F2_9CHLR|nr:hypothetical protein [Tengunoibacter tsumagoiensis]GCE13235.1 hypothetical protein KTT_30940 [Tengunoibacter tsumagoiensis]
MRLETLPLALYIVMAEVSIGAVSVLVFLDWRNEVKRGFLISYAFIYLFLAGMTYLLQQNFSTPELLHTFKHLDQSWTGSLSLPLLLFFLLLIPYSLFLVFDKHAGIQDEVKAEGETVRPPQGRVIRILRLASGIATVLAGLATLFVTAMIYRPVVAGNLGGAFTVAGFFAAAFALGGVMTAMWLGHWYLVTPALSEKPLQFSTTLVLVAIVAQIAFALIASPAALFGFDQAATSTTPATTVVTPTPTTGSAPAGQVKPEGAPVVTPLSIGAISWIRILVAFLMPLVLGGLSWKLIRDRSFQSATGMLYLVVVCALAGEIMARGLFLGGLIS